MRSLFACHVALSSEPCTIYVSNQNPDSPASVQTHNLWIENELKGIALCHPS